MISKRRLLHNFEKRRNIQFFLFLQAKKNDVKTLLDLFVSFFKIGAFTIGGGYAMIPLMEKEIVDRRGWLDRESFLDVMAGAQALPGVFAVNMATQVGYRRRGIIGSVAAVTGNILVPILLILALAIFFRQMRGNAVVEAVFKGVRPAVVALIAAPVFNMAKTASINWRNCWIPITATLLIYLLGVSPTWIVLAAIAGGFLYGRFRQRKEAQP